jgi:hypothetical protein
VVTAWRGKLDGAKAIEHPAIRANTVDRSNIVKLCQSCLEYGTEAKRSRSAFLVVLFVIIGVQLLTPKKHVRQNIVNDDRASGEYVRSIIEKQLS